MEICSFILIVFVCHLCLASCVMDDMTTTQQASHFLIDHRGRIFTAGRPMTLCCKLWEIEPEKVHYNSPQSMYFISTVALAGGQSVMIALKWYFHIPRVDLNVTFSV